MKIFVFIALVMFLGTVATQTKCPKRHHDHHGSPRRAPQGLPHGFHHEPHYGPHHGPHHRCHHGPHHEPHLEPSHGPHHGQSHCHFGTPHEHFRHPPPGDYEPDSRYRDDDSYGPGSWYDDDDNDDKDEGFRPSDEEYDRYGWHNHFHTKHPHRCIKKKPLKSCSTPSSTTEPHPAPHTNRPPLTQSTAKVATRRPALTTWSMTTPIQSLTTPRLTARPTSTVASTLKPTCATGSLAKSTTTTWHPNKSTGETTHWQTTTSSPVTILSTNQEETTLPITVESCIKSCISNQEYNPVCGTDGKTYDNEGNLLCAKICGVDVSLRRRSVCTPSVSEGNNGGGLHDPRSSTVTNPPLIGRTTPSLMFQNCMRQCKITPSFTPVCGTNHVTYMNVDRLKCAQSCGEVVQVLCEKPCAACAFNPVPTTTPKTTIEHFGRISLGPDIKECIDACLATPEYNPVCGSDHVTYINPGRLFCAQTCGVNVSLVRNGKCSPTTTTITTTRLPTTALSPAVITCIRSCPATSEYNPVCGTDGLTYTNIGHLECAKYCGVHVELKFNSQCKEGSGELSDNTDSTPPLTIQDVNENKDEVTASISTITTTTRFTTPTPISVTTSITTPTPMPTSTLGFSIPQKILNDIFESTTTQPHPMSTSTLGFTVPQKILNDIFESTTTQPLPMSSSTLGISVPQKTLNDIFESTTTQPHPMSTSTLGFSVPQKILNDIFESTTTQPHPMSTSTLGFLIPQKILNDIFRSTTTQPLPMSISTLGFSIPQKILNDIFGSTTTQPLPTTTKTTPEEDLDEVLVLGSSS